jgi:hypothetical protein
VLRIGAGRQALYALRDQRPERAGGAAGPDGALYAATLPSGKVYRLKTDATAKQDESSATVVFDAAKLDGAKTAGRQDGDAKSTRSRTTSGI